MKYTVQSFSWGTALIDPEIHQIETATIKEAEKELDRQWQDPRCFHVRALSPLDPTDPFKLQQILYSMKSRPTKDRELRHYFEKITVPDGVKSIRVGKEANVLRVCNYLSETPTSRLHLPARRFYYDLCGEYMEEIDPKLCLDGSKALNLQDFETCLAAAALMPTRIEALLGEIEYNWYFLSEVKVNGNRAELSFSWMKAGTEFVQ
jgi:hypothetical protein